MIENWERTLDLTEVEVEIEAEIASRRNFGSAAPSPPLLGDCSNCCSNRHPTSIDAF